MSKNEIKIVFVCLGNICRSPTAEFVFRDLVEREGLTNHLLIESAGTGGWHVGESPDRRSAAAAKRRGVELGGAARQMLAADFARFDYVIAMDADNVHNLARLSPSAAAKSQVHLFRDFDPDSPKGSEVPDPYYGEGGFDKVFDICQAASVGLLAFLREEHGF
ncbi:MAG: low molecular weight phosphotyrosine protein phosphatase [Deltaproteobacteria bacterium]|nr:low molecular weight phosphotyrosine protein phosphatase [Deltaproteobacteria bacterium]